MVIILDNVINNIDSVKVEIQDILKDQNINEEWCTFEKNHKFQYKSILQRIVTIITILLLYTLKPSLSLKRALSKNVLLLFKKLYLINIIF